MMNPWQTVFKKNLPFYVQLIFEAVRKQGGSSSIVSETLTKLPFKLPTGLVKKKIFIEGKYPVVSQSKELIIGYSDDETLLVSESLPLVIYGDHSKTIKYIDFPFIIGADGVKLLKPSQDIFTKYYYYCLIGIETSTKSYGRHFSLLKKKELVIPKEQETQRSIVAFIEDLEKNDLKSGAYFSKYIEDKVLTLHLNHLRNYSMAHELSHQQALLKKLRQQILQEAIEGKLTADWREKNPDVEPASELLARIKAEKEQLIKDKKIRKGKKQSASESYSGEILIPDEWEYPDLDDVVQYITDGTHQTPRYTQSGRPFLSAQHVKPFKFMPDDHKFVSEEDYQEYIKNKKPESGDILVGRVGSKGEAVVINTDLEFAIYVSLGLVKIFQEHTCSQFLAIVMNSPYGNKYAVGNMSSTGASAGNYNLGRIRSFPVPLPSLPEQKHIVTKVENLFAICDQLEAQIISNQTHAEQLMQAVLKEAFQQSSDEVDLECSNEI